MKHLVFYSGGSGSFEAAWRVLESGVDPSELYLLFTDTLIEDSDLYEFLLESFSVLYNGSITPETADLIAEYQLPELYEDAEERFRTLETLATEVMRLFPNVIWLHYKHEGEFLTPWRIFKKRRFIGNSRVAPCSEIIKQRLAREYVKVRFNPEDLKVYFGIDWTESHRMDAPIKNWSRYSSDVRFPLIQEGSTSPSQRLERMQALGIEIPKLYSLGFSHNNCGGFCVRAGQGHFKNLYRQLPKIFNYHAEQEASLAKAIQDRTGEVYSILTRQEKGKKYQLPLKELAVRVETGGEIDEYEFGGCGCFVTDSVEEVELSTEAFSLKDLEMYKGDQLIPS